MQIVNGALFGKITPEVDAQRAKTFFHYYIGRLPNGDLLFDGVASDEQDAIETVNAHLALLADQLRLRNQQHRRRLCQT